MNIHDAFNKRILTISFGISMVLCSASLLVFSFTYLNAAHAMPKDPVNMAPWDTELRGGVGLGVVKDTGYFVVWAKPNKLYKVDLKSAQDWYQQ